MVIMDNKSWEEDDEAPSSVNRATRESGVKRVRSRQESSEEYDFPKAGKASVNENGQNGKFPIIILAREGSKPICSENPIKMATLIKKVFGDVSRVKKAQIWGLVNSL